MKKIEDVISEVLPTLEEIETQRLEFLKKRRIFLPISILLVVGAVAYAFFGESGGLAVFRMILAMVALIGGIILYQVTAGRLAANYKRDYKKVVIRKLVQLIDPGLEYFSNRGIPSAEFRQSELYTTRPDRYSTEDLIEGDYGKTSLRLAEVHAEDKRTSTDSNGRKRTRYVTIFRGLLLMADFHKHFQGRTFVFPDKAERMLGFLGRNLQKLNGRSGTELIQMEDTEFEKSFVVHSTDQVESRYILSTSMMRRLLDMNERFGKDVRIGFKNSFVWLAVPHSSSYLEPSTGVPATDESQIQQMLDEIKLFLDTIDELNLNTRIWSKE